MSEGASAPVMTADVGGRRNVLGAIWRGAQPMLRHRSSAVGLLMLILLALFTVVGPLVDTQNPLKQNLFLVLLPPSFAHPLGTDELGRDELVRLMYGTRYSLGIGLAAVAVSFAIGVPMGAVSGYLGGAFDLLSQRLTDVLLAFPGILLALALIAGLGRGVSDVVIAVGVSSAPSFIRLARASTLSLKEQGFVEAAQALGVSTPEIILRHIIPNALGPIIVTCSLSIGGAILSASALGFLGLGIVPPTPEWGEMLGEAAALIFSHANLVTYPGFLIAYTVLAFNLVGDGLRDTLDPRSAARA
jgi:peptide/nickel transport system permease protein